MLKYLSSDRDGKTATKADTPRKTRSSLFFHLPRKTLKQLFGEVNVDLLIAKHSTSGDNVNFSLRSIQKLVTTLDLGE